MTTITSGSCLCGKVRFEIEGNFEHFFLCHCTYCQKDTGSAHASNLFSTTATLNWLSGREQVSVYHLPSSRHQKSFCSHCGSALPSTQLEGRLVVVPAGSLDDPLQMRPDAHLFMASKAAWDHELESVPVLQGLPTDSQP